MDEARYLNLLIGAKTRLALSSLEQPVAKDEFTYGHAVGMVRGINMAIELLKEMLDDDKGKQL